MKTAKTKVLAIFIMIFLVVINTTGCWSRRDLTEMAIATAVGLDKTDAGDIEITVQVVKPGVIKARDKGSEEETTWVYSATGKTVFSAIRNLLTTVNRKTYFSHVQLMVIGEELAREGVMCVLDLFERDKETQKKANMIIARGLTAKEVLQAESDLENIPALHINSILDNYDTLAKIRKITFIDLMADFNYSGFSPTVGIIQRDNLTDKHKNQQLSTGEQQSGKAESLQTQGKEDSGQEQKESALKTVNEKASSDQGDDLQIKDLEVKGTAVFKKDKVIGWLEPFETRGLLFALDEVKSGIINVNNPLDKGKKVGYEIFNSSGTLKVEIKDGEPKLGIEVKVLGNLADQQGKGDLTTPEMIKKMNKAVAKYIENNIQSAVDRAQQDFKVDYFGFSQMLYKNHVQYWRKVEKDWSNVFSKLPVEIKVEWTTDSSALIKRTSTAR